MLIIYLQEFERQSLPGYKLTKEGDYYFLIVNKALTHQLRYVNHLNKSDFSHFVIPGNDEIGEEDLDGKKLAISKEERSYSLPCVFTGPSESTFHPRETRSFRNTGDETTGSEPGAIKQRPRSCSDAKSSKRSVSVRSRGNVCVKPQVSLPEANKALEAIGALRIQEEEKDLDPRYVLHVMFVPYFTLLSRSKDMVSASGAGRLGSFHRVDSEFFHRNEKLNVK